MKLGIIKEGKNPPDERVPIAPEQCLKAIQNHPNLELAVQQSEVRRFKDEEYRRLGIEVVQNLEDCDVIMGVKEVPKDMLLAGKTYFFFSHTIKMQPYNRDLLREVLKKNIRLIDWECLLDEHGKRVIGFGRYAGIVGAYNTFRAWGLKFGTYELKPAHACADYEEVKAELQKVKLPAVKIVITGRGRVASGILEILQLLKIRKVLPAELLEDSFDETVFAQLSVIHYAKRKDGTLAKSQDYYSNPEWFTSDFLKYAKVADVYISGHYWDSKAPYLISKQDLQHADINLKVVGDISCDIDGPIGCTIRPSTIADPIYGYNPTTMKEADFKQAGNIAVMAVDNLPCELPKDASKDFGNEILQKVLPELLKPQLSTMLANATIAQNGALTPKFQYLQAYVDGK